MGKRVMVVGLLAVLFCMGIYVSAQLSDTTRKKGDVNGDGVVNVLDALRGVNIILEIQPPPTDDEVWAADCNGDGQLNILDVLGIVNVILEIGTCVSSCAEMNCDDGNPCTEDRCDSLLVQCFHDTLVYGSACDDGNLCTDNDRCIDGLCQGTQRNCDDGNPCTEDSCDPAKGCTHKEVCCGNGMDDDGDGVKDCSDSDCLIDQDKDGYNAAPCGGDLDDTDPTVNPGAPEICGDGKDNDCDGHTDCDDSDCTVDQDHDGYYGPPCGNDCNDTDASIHPGAAEVCNGIDDDCDNQTDEDLTGGRYYRDSDGDGYGDLSAYKDTSCVTTLPTGYVVDSTDCNDDDASIHPGATESCNGKDDNCDNQTDEEDAAGCTTYYRDNDNDGYGCANYGHCVVNW